MSETVFAATPALPSAPIDLAWCRVRVSAPPEGRVLQIMARRGATLAADRLAFLGSGDGAVICEIAPGQWVVIADAPISPGEVAAAAQTLFDVAHLFDIGPGRVRMRLEGSDTVELLSNFVAIDLSPRAFPVGHLAATLVGHSPAWLVRPGETSFEIVVSRSFAADVHEALIGHG